MKRSEINKIIKNAIEFFDVYNFKLPPWAFWEPEDWKGKGINCSEIIENKLGWDVTSFDSDDFYKKGLVLFTLRNGRINVDKKTYAEKIMVVEEGQITPMHFHWNKMEDIINRGGGNLTIELYASTDGEELSNDDIEISIDGIKRILKQGGRVILEPGMSICLKQRVYHRFYGELNKGKVLVGEVSQVNDDDTDNRFYERLSRFPRIIEDQKPLHLLVNDYKNWI